ncbi:Cytochrome P450 [Seinonella peptonophila]|uniref:Cytochrome P450 n=1 Tax=Seinonella peptonophila TaxID=112248 RepID=A0A1M4Y9B9_9BACL|nr:cytochrome P450 [Seinonella peptonophila]SHF02457.1 Cytochrome P450 [Seinonella peptonophila]
MTTNEWNAQDPFPFYSQMRNNNAVHYNESLTITDGRKGAWEVFRYEDVKRVLSDYQFFTSDYYPSDAGEGLSKAFIYTDPPIHKKYRMGYVMKAYGSDTAERLTPFAEYISERIVNQLKEKNSAEIVSQFSAVIPIEIICILMGVPLEDAKQFGRWADIVTTAANGGDLDINEFTQAQQEMAMYFMGVFQEKRKKPQDDFISRLMLTKADGVYLNDTDLLGTAILMLLAGHETTKNLISSCLLVLSDQPELQFKLSEQPQKIPNFITEVLRFYSPFQSVYRKAAQDVVLGGMQIKKGDLIVPYLGSANRDEQKFANPDQFDMERQLNVKNLAFGHGVHQCIGMDLAQTEAVIAIKTLLDAVKDIQVNKDSIEMHNSYIVYGIRKMEVSWSMK